MKMPKYSFENAKHLVVKNVGNEVYFKSKVARGKYYEDKGRITAAYKNIFTVKTTHNGKEDLLTFPYSDIVNATFAFKSFENENQIV